MKNFIIIFLILLNLFIIDYYDKVIDIMEETYLEIISTKTIKSEIPTTNLGKFNLTWYCPCEKCVGKKKEVKTATGTKPTRRTIAVDPKIIPLGSIVYIEDYGYFIAEDTGSMVKQNTIDIFVPTHEEALKHGRKVANVWILQ